MTVMAERVAVWRAGVFCEWVVGLAPLSLLAAVTRPFTVKGWMIAKDGSASLVDALAWWCAVVVLICGHGLMCRVLMGKAVRASTFATCVAAGVAAWVWLASTRFLGLHVKGFWYLFAVAAIVGLHRAYWASRNVSGPSSPLKK